MIKLETEFETLLISPSLRDMKYLKIRFEKSFNEILYVAQFRSFSDENDFHTHVVFKFEDKIYHFREFENAERCSFSEYCDESSIEKFLESIEQYEKFSQIKVINNIKINENYLNIKSKIKKAKHKEVKVKI